jgi:nucleotide-binding universal stress UspA family protein
MTTFVVATDHVDASALLCDYLFDRVDADDELHAVNSLPGGEGTDTRDVRDGEEALNVISSRLGGFTTVETRQFVRGNRPHEDVLRRAAAVDADEVVIGVRQRSPTAKVVFGSTAQRILRESDRPVVAVPLSDPE